MKLKYPALLALMCTPMVHANDIVITGVVDGSLSGGLPKAIELFVLNDIADLSTCGVGAANNGGGTDGQEITFNSGAASAGTYIYIASEAPQFTTFFGFAPDYTSNAASINGDDAIELFCNDTVVDVFGDINTDGSGEDWDYQDGWAARNADTGPDGTTFTIASWTFSGTNVLDGVATNASADTPYPLKSYADEVDNGGGGGGGDDGGSGGEDEGLCTNCPDVDKVADASTFSDSEYYAPVITEVNAGSDGSFIKTAITDVISENINYLSYTQAWTVLTESDQDPENSDNIILIYSGKSIPKSENASGDFANFDDFWNREHVWPNSHGFADDGDRDLPPVLEAFADVHHLRPADRSVNASRGNLDFDESDGALTEAPANSIDDDSFEPRDEVKGDVARMMLYMDTRYEGIDDSTPNLVLVDEQTNVGEPRLGKLCTLLAWHEADPVSEFEQNRNNVLYEYQGNRNPYVDHPEWVDLIYSAESCEGDNGGGDGGGDGEEPTTPEMIITGVIDGPLSGGHPKAIEIFVASGSDDISACGIGSANNGGGSDGEEFTFSGSAETGQFIYVSAQEAGFESFFGFKPDFVSGAANINGDDAIELFCDGQVVDVLGDINTDGTGQPWEHLDGWAYRTSFTGPDGATFQLGSWGFSGPNALDGESDNGTAETPFPIGSFAFEEKLIITGVIDGPLPGGLPKAVEFYAATSIADLSVYGFGSANNGGGSDGEEYTFTGSASKGDYIYIASDSTNFNTFFGFNPDATNDAANINGDDAIELFKDGEVVDVFGDIDTDGTGQPWEHLDGWAYRVNDTGPDGDTFVLESWTFSGPNALDGEATNASAEVPFPIASFAGAGNGGGDGGGDGEEPIEIGLCTDPATFIHEIQGSGDATPIPGTSVIVQAVVTAAYQGEGQLGGYFLQEEDADADADLSTSEGVFVFDPNNDVAVGDLVRILGTTEEFFDLTQISDVTGLVQCDTGQISSVSASSLTLPISSLDEYEQVEGMLVAFSQPLTVNETFVLSRFGQVTLSDGRAYQFTHDNAPSVEGYAAHLEALALNQIILDDASSTQNPGVVIHPAGGLSASNTLRGGSVANISGVMSYSFGEYRVQPIEDVVFTGNDRPASPDDVGGNFKVAGINVLNYFTTLDENGNVCGPSDLGCRGAESAEEFARQRVKIVGAIAEIDADIVGLVELENDDGQAITDLVAGLNDIAGAGTYAFVDTGTIGGDAIKVGLIYKPATANPTGAFAILDSSVDPLFIDDKNRPALAQTFTTESGEVFTISINHFKSKGSSCDDIGDPDLNDGQANCAGTRADAATALVNWLASDPTDSGDADYLILGDLNAYAQETAITNITDAGYDNLISTFAGDTSYSFVFDAQVGYLDHALATPSLTDKVSDVTEWHINADEPVALDYNVNFKSEAQITNFYAPDVYRMSDHDPVIIGFDFVAEVLPGDYDGDGDLDIVDLRAMIRALRSGETLNPAFDVDGNGVVDIRDVLSLRRQCTNPRCAP